ncbi:MAG: PAS domain-containing protein [Phycisphaerae bacterium]
MTPSDGEIQAAQSSAILRNTPNGVLMVGRDTRIRFENPSFRRMFHCQGETVIGRPAAEILHSSCFERAIAAGGHLMVKETIPQHDLTFRAGLFPLEGEDLFCGIFIDITEEEHAREQLRIVRAQTLQRAQEVIERQMQTAQEIARLLGETTAETKVLLVKLMSLFQEEPDR